MYHSAAVLLVVIIITNLSIKLYHRQRKKRTAYRRFCTVHNFRHPLNDNLYQKLELKWGTGVEGGGRPGLLRENDCALQEPICRQAGPSLPFGAHTHANDSLPPALMTMSSQPPSNANPLARTVAFGVFLVFFPLPGPLAQKWPTSSSIHREGRSAQGW
jgi:hypothetical protein